MPNRWLSMRFYHHTSKSFSNQYVVEYNPFLLLLLWIIRYFIPLHENNYEFYKQVELESIQTVLISPIWNHFTVKIVDLLYECIMCSLSPCIKSTALRFKIPRESLHIPMDKRAQQLIDPIGISRRWFFKTCLLGLTCHQIYFSMCTCKI